MTTYSEELEPNKLISYAGITLAEDEFVILEALVRGPGYPLLQKILIKGAAQLMGQLEVQNEDREIYRLQGQIKAFRWLQNVPGALVTQETNRRQNLAARKEAKRKSAPASP